MTKKTKLTSHILELRKRVMFCLVSYALICIPFIIFAPTLFEIFTQSELAPYGAQMIATQVTSPFMVPLKLALYLGLYLSVPILCYQIWSFVAPGLYKAEKKPILWLSFCSISLFYLGACFAYFVVCPIALKFFAMMAPKNVQVMTDMGLFLSFVLKMLVMFGLAFQVPIVVCILLMLQIQTSQSLKAKRPYVIVFSFVIGMLLTPPDVISQILMAIPMILLFEMGLWLSAFLMKKQTKALPHKTL